MNSYKSHSHFAVDKTNSTNLYNLPTCFASVKMDSQNLYKLQLVVSAIVKTDSPNLNNPPTLFAVVKTDSRNHNKLHTCFAVDKTNFPNLYKLPTNVAAVKTDSQNLYKLVWRYTHADFAKASRMISKTDWDKRFSEDIDLYCARWQQTFLSIMEQCIPKKVLPPRRHNLPWLSKSLVQSMRRRN